ncbi:MAG: M48 family metalloprotease [Acidimicrobiaceae bacterium]|nr:M48 family metalloprotease [Acidimicrobiaceae bacterium]
MSGSETQPSTRVVRTVGAFALPLGVIAGLIGLAGGWVVAVVLFVVVAAISAAWARFGGDRRVVAAVDGQPPDPVRHARLINLVEGLSASAGIRVPVLRVLDQPGLNAMAAGLRRDRALVVVTEGLLQELTRIELEGVLAEVAVQIRRGDTVPLTVLAATWGWGARFAVPANRDATADQLATSLTRYPPGLEAALAKMAARGTVITGLSRGLSQLWLADPVAPRPADGPAWAGRVAAHIGRLPLPERVEALREL